MLYVNYFKPFLENTFTAMPSTHALDYLDRTEQVLMVPGSIAQMIDDMLADDERDYINDNGY